MIQQGIIKELIPNENCALVRIPIYETSQGEEAIFNCVLSCIPGIINGYQVGDIVIVGFENDQLDLPIVLSKLYLGVSREENSYTSMNVDNLNVSGRTTLNEDFSVGEVTYKDLLSLKKKLQQEEQEDN